MALIVRGERIQVHGVRVADFLEEPDLRLLRPWNYRPRREAEQVDAVVMHCGRGWDQPVRERPAEERDLGARGLVRSWRGSSQRFAGAHLVVDACGTALCCADLALDAAYHTSGHNGRSVGIEVVQREALHRAQVRAVLVLVDALRDLLGVQPYLYAGSGAGDAGDRYPSGGALICAQPQIDAWRQSPRTT